MSPLRKRPLRGLTIASVAGVASCVLATAALASTDHGAAYRADPPTVKPYIVGGAQINVTQAPWQVYIRADAGGGAYVFCGGSILDASTIMTAGHCLYNETNGGLPFLPTDFTVWAGVSSFDTSTGQGTGGQSSAVTAAIPHPYYSNPAGGTGTPDDYQDDVAILKLATPLTLNGTTEKAIPLGAENSVPTIGAAARVTGFGLQDPNASAPDGNLYALNETVGDPAAAGANNAVITIGSVATGSACSGDSGGGLTSGPSVIGVVSSGATTCDVNSPNFYTNITAGELQEFIKNPANLTPPRAPRGGTDIVMRTPDMTPSKGDALTCSPGTWTNSPTYTYRFTDTRNGRVLQFGSSSTYKVTGTTDAGATISCRVYAANAGGVGLTPPTQAAPAVKAAPTPAPTPTPTPTPKPPKKHHHKHKQPKKHYKVSSSLSASKSSVRRGQTVTYTAKVSNRGNQRLRNVRSCVKLSSRFSLVSRHHGKVSHGSICWTTSSLRVKHSTTHRVKVRIDRDARLGRFATKLRVNADPRGSDSAVRSVRVRAAARRNTPTPPPGVTG